MTNQRSILLSRVVSLIQEVETARNSLDKLLPQFAKPIRGRLAETFGRQVERLENLQKGVSDAQSDQQVANYWHNYNERKKECEPLFEECLTLVQGAAVRQSQFDRGLCNIADALLNDLSDRTGIAWGRFTIQGTGEAFSKVPQVIRIRFPEPSIWNLPIAVHEFGHFVGPRLEKEEGNKIYRSLQELLEREKDTKAQSYLQELIGDVFATYTLGPAYACTCILLRFDPWTAYVEGEEHPGNAQRAYCILRVLEKLDEAGSTLPFRQIAEHLRGSWRSVLALAGQPASLKEKLAKAEVQQLKERLDLLYRKIDDQLFDVRYKVSDWQRAVAIAEKLPGHGDLTVQDDYTLIDVLNAAWRSRLQHMQMNDSRIPHIGRRAFELCTLLLRKAVGQ